MKLADVLWEAANTKLRTTHEDCDRYQSGVSPYSCDAVLYWLGENGDEDRALFRSAMSFLDSLGNPGGFEAFNHVPKSKRQGVRYMWLLLAMHVAEDEGIEI